MAPVTEFTSVLWLCKYGKNHFLSQFFGCTLGGVGNWVQHSFFHCLLRIPRTLYGWNFVFGSQLLHHLTAMWNIEQIQIFHILLHFQAWISQSIWLTDLPNFLSSVSAMLAVGNTSSCCLSDLLHMYWLFEMWKKKSKTRTYFMCFSHTLYNAVTIHTAV